MLLKKEFPMKNQKLKKKFKDKKKFLKYQSKIKLHQKGLLFLMCSRQNLFKMNEKDIKKYRIYKLLNIKRILRFNFRKNIGKYKFLKLFLNFFLEFLV
jgi:hypothetical protein